MLLAITPLQSYQFQKVEIIYRLGTASLAAFNAGAFMSSLHYTALLFTNVKGHVGERKVFHSTPKDSNRGRAGV